LVGAVYVVGGAVYVVGGVVSVVGGTLSSGAFPVVVNPELLPLVVAYTKDELLIVMALIKRKINSEVAANEIVLPCVVISIFTGVALLSLCIILF
jgi:hypothetical protein